MSKIDKIIQIIDSGCDDILGLSESGVLYKYNADHTNGYTGENYPANWEPLLESPVVDNSACDGDEVSKYDIPPVSCGAVTKEHFSNFVKKPK